MKVAEFMATQHHSDSTATLEENDIISGANTRETSRSPWVRVIRTEGMAVVASSAQRRVIAPIIGSDPINSDQRSEIEHIVRRSEATPDIREGIVASLRDRIESGSYFVGAETIAEMMLRRTVANRLQ